MHKDEFWQLYAHNGEPLSDGKHPSYLGNPSPDENKIYGIVLVFLYRIVDGDIELLFQKRSETVDRFPNLWDISAGGHVNFEESILTTAVRESREEIGASILPEEMQYGFSDLDSSRFTTTFLCDWTGKKDSFSFADGEVSEVKWVKLSESDDFRHKFCKPRVASDELYFTTLKNWFKVNGYLDK